MGLNKRPRWKFFKLYINRGYVNNGGAGWGSVYSEIRVSESNMKWFITNMTPIFTKGLEIPVTLVLTVIGHFSFNSY